MTDKTGRSKSRARKGKVQKQHSRDPIKEVLRKGLAEKPLGGCFGPVQMSVLAKYLLRLHAEISELELQQADLHAVSDGAAVSGSERAESD